MVAVTCLMTCWSLCSQERQGNIVEYFGKEKITDVREGKVLHTFTQGLILGGDRSSRSGGTTPKDAVVASLLFDPDFQIKEGDKGAVSRSGETKKWEAVTVDEKNEFSDRRLRSGYLYLQYETSQEETVLIDASGHTKLFVNGLPYEGDHYDFGWSLIPIRLNPGMNTFLLTVGRFPRMRARLLSPEPQVQLTPRDMTLPDLIIGKEHDLLGAIRILNASEDWFEGSIQCEVNGLSRQTDVGPVGPLHSRKVAFTIPSPKKPKEDKIKVKLSLRNTKGDVISQREIELAVKSMNAHHKRTFLSQIDESVQYFGVAPCTDPDLGNPAMFLSVHGASVEAIGQARAYQSKDWGHLIAPTNRRPFGFAWEDWGRLDAMEVLDHASEVFGTDPQRTYLTGHSMGGHGTWYLGATYPDRFAAIGPAAGYPDLLEYRNSFRRRLQTASDEDLKRFGMTRERAQQMIKEMDSGSSEYPEMEAMIRRAGNPSRTLKLQKNYLHHGVYVLHGEKDTVVPTYLAREMREVLSKFHPDFAYYEYPGGTHWYGNHSVDWKPLFDFFEFRTIKAPGDIDKLEFHTASPGVSASSHFITIVQQLVPFEISSFQFERSEIPKISTENIAALKIDLESMGKSDRVQVDDQVFDVKDLSSITFKRNNVAWHAVDAISKNEKGPHRNGGFKDAFNHRMVLVFATGGSNEENQWYYRRAKHDAETFWYRGNGNVELMKDTDFDPASYMDRNVILYGNRDNHASWNHLLKDCPIQVTNGSMKVGDRQLSGDYGAYFIYPRRDSELASVGVVTASGSKGMKAAHANWYLTNGSTFPDVLVFHPDFVRDGIAGVELSGFFGNDWSVKNGDFVWESK